jgi:hypothetical protein
MLIQLDEQRRIKKNAYKVISRGSDDIGALLDLAAVAEDVK